MRYQKEHIVQYRQYVGYEANKFFLSLESFDTNTVKFKPRRRGKLFKTTHISTAEIISLFSC